MKLITKELLNAAKKQGDTSELPSDKVQVLAKFFTPDAQCTWFITEINTEAEIMFGLCDLGMGCPELGYVSIHEMEGLRGKMGLPVERDLYWKGTLADAMRELGA